MDLVNNNVLDIKHTNKECFLNLSNKAFKLSETKEIIHIHQKWWKSTSKWSCIWLPIQANILLKERSIFVKYNAEKKKIKVSKAGEIYWIYQYMTDGERIRHLTSVWMRKYTVHFFFYNLKKIECMKFLKRMLIYFISLYLKNLRNRLCNLNKKDKIILLYRYFE